MKLSNEVNYRVLLPKSFWEQAQNEEELKKLIVNYMRHYPNYRIKSVKDGFAICEKKVGGGFARVD